MDDRELHPRRPHVGIVACSAEGAALCFRTLCVEGAARFGEHAHPDVSLHTHCLADYMVHVRAGDWRGVAGLMRSSATRLAGCGAHVLICPDNTIHEALPYLADAPLPWLHIADAVADEAARAGHRVLGVLGTRYLMEGPVYRDVLSARGIGFQIPDVDARARINRVIFDELVAGVFSTASRRAFNHIIAELGARGCDAVVLGCTEIPLLVRPPGSDLPDPSPLPTLDSTRLLARAALRWAAARPSDDA